MKRIQFLLLMVCALDANAQNYLISFAGTGGSNIINTVKVDNLTKGTTRTLNGDDILHLTGTVGISSTDYGQSLNMKIYPNPMKDNSVVEVSPPVAGDAVITVFDMAGRQLSKTQSYLDKSGQEFRLSGLRDGFYIITARGNSYEISGKLLCTGKSDGTISLEKVSNNIQIDEEKTSKADKKGVQATIDMPYTTGDRLKFTSISGNFSTVITDIPAQNKTITFNFIACTDPENNNYPVVTIGTQLWMAENLKTTKYNNGDLIGTTTPATLNITNENAPKYQWAYAGDESKVATYGRMYTWYAVTDIRGVCPAGWHIPTDAEWTILTIYSGGESVASAKLKESGLEHWFSPNSGATNETGFTALPGGLRTFDGIFYGIFMGGTWWGSTLHTQTGSYGRGMTYYGVDFGYTYGTNEQKSGFSVRCIKDN